MRLKEQLAIDMKQAMKERNVLKKDTLRMIDSMIKNVEIEKMKREEGLSDIEVQEVIARAIKQRKEAVQQYESGGRQDLAEKEAGEIDILMSYMPEQLSEEKLREIIKTTIAENSDSGKIQMGKIMGLIMTKVKGKADGQIVKKIVEEELS